MTIHRLQIQEAADVDSFINYLIDPENNPLNYQPNDIFQFSFTNQHDFTKPYEKLSYERENFHYYFGIVPKQIIFQGKLYSTLQSILTIWDPKYNYQDNIARLRYLDPACIVTNPDEIEFKNGIYDKDPFYAQSRGLITDVIKQGFINRFVPNVNVFENKIPLDIRFVYCNFSFNEQKQLYEYLFQSLNIISFTCMKNPIDHQFDSPKKWTLKFYQNEKVNQIFYITKEIEKLTNELLQEIQNLRYLNHMVTDIYNMPEIKNKQENIQNLISYKGKLIL